MCGCFLCVGRGADPSPTAALRLWSPPRLPSALPSRHGPRLRGRSAGSKGPRARPPARGSESDLGRAGPQLRGSVGADRRAGFKWRTDTVRHGPGAQGACARVRVRVRVSDLLRASACMRVQGVLDAAVRSSHNVWLSRVAPAAGLRRRRCRASGTDCVRKMARFRLRSGSGPRSWSEIGAPCSWDHDGSRPMHVRVSQRH